MSKQTEKRTGEFILADADGNSYRIIEFTTYVHVAPDGRHQLIPNRKRFQLQNGDHVNFSDEGGFEIAHNGVRLSKVAS